jgi:nitronate monooxygenase
MFRVCGPDLVIAASRTGIAGSFPTANCRSSAELDEWVGRIVAGVRTETGRLPWGANLIIKHARRDADLEVLLAHRPDFVITSVGSPAPVIAPLHEAGISVLADVASIEHARKAAASGVDGLVLLSAGAGGNTGWLNPFVFVRAVREFFTGPIILAGGITDGTAIAAAELLGCDLVYLGTKAIATTESMADDAYKQMLVDSTADDIQLTKAFTGMPTNMLRPSIVAAGLDPSDLDEDATPLAADGTYGGARPDGPGRWSDVWAAGHTVSGVRDRESIADVVAGLRAEYLHARSRHL